MDHKKILIVDDEPEMVSMIEKFLESAGYAVSTASDGDMALALVRDNLFDLILMDITLPKVDGWQVCHRLKADPKFRKIPIILFSGLLVEDSEANGALEKCDYLMAKPIQMQSLLQKVKEFIKPT